MHTAPVEVAAAGTLQSSPVVAAAMAPALSSSATDASKQQQHHAGAGATMALDLVAGTAAGTAQLLVGHPFDTIKVCSR